MFARTFVLLLGFIALLAGIRADGNSPATLTAYFKGDALQESVLKLTPAREKAVRRLDRILEETRRFVRVEIVALHADGALVSVTCYSSEELKADSPSPIEHPFFIYGLPENLPVGAKWEGRTYPAGQFRFTSADKSDQSINALAATKEWAIRAMESAAPAMTR